MKNFVFILMTMMMLSIETPAGAATIDENEAEGRLSFSMLSANGGAGSWSGAGVDASAHLPIRLLPVSVWGGLLTVDLGADFKARLASKTGEPGATSPSLIEVGVRSPGLALAQLKLADGTYRRRHAYDIRLLQGRYVFDEKALVETRTNGALLSAIEAKGRSEFFFHHGSIALCSTLAPAQVVVGKTEVQGEARTASYAFDASACAELKLGQSFALNNTTRLHLQPGATSLSNQTLASVSARDVKFELGYKLARESSESSDATRASEIVSHQFSVGVAY